MGHDPPPRHIVNRKTKMREMFHHYFRPTEIEFRDIWQKGIFAFDANILLNIYRYSEDTRNSLLTFIADNSDRIRLPHQFAFEFVRNRSKIIVAQAIKYEKTRTTFENIEKEIGSKSEHPHLTKRARKAINFIKNELTSNQKIMESLISEDEYVSKIDALLAHKIGQGPTETELAEIYCEAKKRFESATPPGYVDAKEKEPPDCYGDYVAWQQLIAIAVNEDRDLILVTDDAKEDWWRIESGRTIGPRPELLMEFMKRSGHKVWFYSSDRFLVSAKKYLQSPIDEKVIKEVENRIIQKRGEEEAKLEKLIVPDFGAPNEDKLSPSAADKPKVDREEEES